MNEYQKQANDFLAKFGITFEAIRAVPQTCPEWSKCEPYKFHPESFHKPYVTCPHNHGLKYSLQFTRTTTGKTLIFPFWNSINDTYRQAALKALQWSASGRMKDEIPRSAVTPTAYDALACISGDAHIYSMQFDEYCNEFGYDTNSIKAKDNYDYGCKFSRDITRFFTADELVELQEIQ